MSFLAGFGNDIFISYSHVDNLGDRWVERFHSELEIALARRIGQVGVVKIWRDKRLEGNQLFDETIRDAVHKTAVFLAITSNGYLASNYCRQELAWFSQKAAADAVGPHIGDRSRIYNVLIASIPYTKWPSEFGRISGYSFNTAKDADDLGEATDPELDKLHYKEQLKALADSLYKTLVAFKERIDGSVSPTRAEPAAVAGPTVFVAAVADSLASIRRRVVVDLERKGVSVEAGIPPPYPAADHEQRVATAARAASLSVHLLDQLPGREIDGDPGCSYPQKQVQIVAAQRRSQLIWVPKTLDTASIEEEGYRRFLDELENGERAHAQYDFIRGTAPLLATQILEKLAPAGPPAVEQRGVLLDTHLKDQLYAFEISKLLLTNNIQPYINPQEDDPGKNLDAFEARLKQVSTLAVVYGSVTEDWVRQRLGLALQMATVKRLPLKAFCVVLVPPTKQDRALTFSVGAIAVGLIDNSASTTVNPSLFGALLESATGA